MYNALIEQHPAGRIGEVNDFLGTVLFLASEVSNFVTGQVIYVDGGWTSGRPVEVPDEQSDARGR